MRIIWITIVGYDAGRATLRIAIGRVVPLVVLVHMAPLHSFVVIVNVSDLCSNLRLGIRLVFVISAVYVACKRYYRCQEQSTVHVRLV